SAPHGSTTWAPGAWATSSCSASPTRTRCACPSVGGSTTAAPTWSRSTPPAPADGTAGCGRQTLPGSGRSPLRPAPYTSAVTAEPGYPPADPPAPEPAMPERLGRYGVVLAVAAFCAGVVLSGIVAGIYSSASGAPLDSYAVSVA